MKVKNLIYQKMKGEPVFNYDTSQLNYHKLYDTRYTKTKNKNDFRIK